MEKLQVEEKIIAYFDILGYKQRLSEENNENAFLDLVKSSFTLTALQNLQHFNENNNLRIQTFSDNIFICANKKTDPKYLDSFLSMIGKIQHDLIVENDIFVRGCITVGNVYIDNEIVYGSGLVKAVKGEETAKWPIIEIDDSFIDLYNGKSENSKVITVFNDKHYLNFLNEDITSVYSENSLNKIKKRIEDNTKLYAKMPNTIKQGSTILEKEKVIKKYMWLVTFFNSNVKDEFKINYKMEINPKYNVSEIKIL